jgi:dTDP-4-amino-4,6-dideoxygalactose transaminase
MIPLVDLVAQYRSIQPEIDAAIQRVLESGHFILGAEVQSLEQEVAAYLGARHAVGLASGTDALVIALRALEIGPGDEVIIPAYTFFATAGAVLLVGARPVFAEIDPLTYCLDVADAARRVTDRTRAIIPVHLYGHPAQMNAVLDLARLHHLKVIEDNAQAFGATYHGRKTASLGDIGCLSFFPTKNLGAAGDAGMAVTDDPGLAEKMRMLRTHGWKQKYYPEMLGYNSRLDALQAAILRAKLPHLDAWNARRRELAHEYSRRLSALGMGTPYEAEAARHVFHLYVVRLNGRERLQSALKQAGIAAEVYYPQPPYLAEPCRSLGYRAGDFPIAERASRESLALPLFPEMTVEQMDMIVAALKSAWPPEG